MMFACNIGSGIELRLFMPHHASELSALIRENHAHISPWLAWATPDYNTEQAHAFIQRGLQKLADNNGLETGIFHHDQLIGAVGYGYWNWLARRTEIGYWLAASFQGQGVMTRAAHQLTDYALTTLALNRVEIRMDVANERSAAIPERLGFTFEGVRRQYDGRHGELHDTKFYFMLAEDWQHHQS